MLGVVAATAAGWLLLFVVLLVVPPLPWARPLRAPEGRPPAGLYPGDEPPAVVSLLAGRPSPAGFGATLADLAGRGWFQVSALTQPAALPAGGWTPAETAMCVIAAEPPDEPLAPFERRVVAHVAQRAGARGHVPAPALSDGFEGGTAEFMKAFGEEVEEEARRRGLIRSRLSSARIGWLGALLLVPAGALLAVIEASRHHDALLYLGLGYLILAGLTVRIGHGRRRSAAGRAALKRWRAATAAPGGDGRLLACAAGLGTASSVTAIFAAAEPNLVWTSYRGGWQQLAVEGSPWSTADALMRLARRTMSPRFAEFDGQVVRQTVISGGEDSPDEFYVVIDDGVRPTAWNLKVEGGPYGLLTVGTYVHARVNLDDSRQVTVLPTGPTAVAGPLAEVAAEQRQAATGGLPDPADLVTTQDAAAVLGGPVQAHLQRSPVGRAVSWQLTGTARPVLRIDVRPAGRTPAGLTPAQVGHPVPGVAGGYLMRNKAVLYTAAWTVILTIQGTAPTGNDGALVHILSLVAERIDFNQY